MLSTLQLIPFISVTFELNDFILHAERKIYLYFFKTLTFWNTWIKNYNISDSLLPYWPQSLS